jgi:sucrose-6-phosphate hydrolase SacC (GH32 family)
MFKWKKLGRIFNPADLKGEHWMREYAQAPSIIIFDNYVRVYFSSRPLPDGNGQYISRLGYIDLNRKNLFDIVGICHEPILPVGSLGTFDEFGTYPASVIKTQNEIRVYYAGWTRCESVPFNAAIGVALSYDNGNTFTKIGEGPVLAFTPDEPYVLGSPKIRKFKDTWYLWYSSGRTWIPNNGSPQPVYKIRMAYSADGIEWTRIGKNLIDDRLEENECQASPDVFYYKGIYHMFFSYRPNLNFKEKGRGYKIGYAWSKDLLTWQRDDAQAGIDVSESGWDSDSVSYGFVFELDNEIYMLHQGNEIGRYGFGLAQLESHN